MRSAAPPRLSIFLVLACLGLPALASAQLTMVEAGFTATTLSGDFSKQIEIGVGPDTCIYYGSFEGLKRRCSPAGAELICDPAIFFPVGISFSTGGSFGNFMYVADYGRDNIYRANGCVVATLFAPLLGPGSIAFPPAGSPYGDYLYACTAFVGPINRINAAGVVSPWLPMETLYVRFGPGGAWGFGMYATQNTTPPTAGIVRVSAAAAATPFISGMNSPEGFDWGFDGDMFATDVNSGEILRVKPNGTKTVFATLPGAADVAWRSKDQALYAVSNQGGLYRIARTNPVGLDDTPAMDLRLTILPNPSPAGCVLRYVAARDGVVRARVLDASGRLVRRLVEAWRPAGAHSIPWDGRDASGVRVRPGTYFAKVEAGGHKLVSRVTITRQ